MKQHYEELREEGFSAYRAGELVRAKELLESAVAVAEAAGHDELVDAARCNLSWLLLQIGEGERAEEGLREILLRSRNPRIQRGAAVSLALALKGRHDFEKALFYARKALRAARLDRDPEAIAATYNLMGTLAMNQSRLPRAERLFRVALAIRERRIPDSADADDFNRIVYLDNLGYCLVLQDRADEGLPYLHDAYRRAVDRGVPRYVSECAQDICFGLLKKRALAEAADWGARSLQGAESGGFADIQKNCCYLLGEVHSLLGHEGLADAFFERLVAHYPDLPFLREFLRTFDISGLITLKEF